MAEDLQLVVGKKLLRSLARLLGVDMQAYDVEVARLDAMSDEERQKEARRRLEEFRQRPPSYEDKRGDFFGD